MIKPIEIIEIQPFFLTFKFNNGEVKKLFVEPILKNESNQLIAEKILKADFFKQVKIGDLGQIYWQNAAFMKDENGNTISCEYDMSPEFIYHNSVKEE